MLTRVSGNEMVSPRMLPCYSGSVAPDEWPMDCAVSTNIVSRQLADDIGTVFGTLVGAALIEVIRDSLGE